MDLQERENAVKQGRRNPRPGPERSIPYLDEAARWCRSRSPWVRLPFMVYGLHCVILAAVSLGNDYPRTFLSPIFSMVDFGFSWLNLGIHELGHVVFGIFGMFMSILGGSLSQCLVPVLCVFMFYRQRDFFAIGFCFLWLGLNFMDVAVYVADARLMELYLVSPFGGGEIIHDWNWLLGKMGLLEWDKGIAYSIRFLAFASMTAFLLSGGWMLTLMFGSKKEEPQLDEIC